MVAGMVGSGVVVVGVVDVVEGLAVMGVAEGPT